MRSFSAASASPVKLLSPIIAIKRKEKIEFTKDNFLSFAERKLNELGGSNFNQKTVSTDFEVLTKMYIRTTEQIKDKEDTFSGLLTDLNLIQEEKKSTSLYSIPNEQRINIPEEIILYTILDRDDFQNSISLNTIFQERNQAGSVFAIKKNSLMEKLESFASNSKYKQYGVTFSDNAGIKELQFTLKPKKFDILNDYYAK